MIEGETRMDTDRLAQGDQARIVGVDRVDVEALAPTHLMLIDLP